MDIQDVFKQDLNKGGKSRLIRGETAFHNNNSCLISFCNEIQRKKTNI